MNQLIEVMKQVAVNAVESAKPVNVRTGKILSLSPFQVQLSQEELFGKEFFIALHGPAQCGGACHKSCTETDPNKCPALWNVGDELILLRLQGGQQFLILGKKVAL